MIAALTISRQRGSRHHATAAQAGEQALEHAQRGGGLFFAMQHACNLGHSG
jgi:hypothetical protein